MDFESVPEPVAEPLPENQPVNPAPAASVVPDVPFRSLRPYHHSTDRDDAARRALTRYPRWLVVSTILMAALLAHGLCLRSTFYFDDWTQIVSNEWVEYGAWWEANLRALTYFTYRVTYTLFGFSSPAFHAGNLALHLVVAVLVAGFGRQLLAEIAGLPPESSRRIGWWAGLVFAVHPLCSEVVNYTRMRDIELASLFTLLAARAAIRWRRQRRPGFLWPAATLLAVAAATLCKEVGFILAAGTASLVWFRTPRRPVNETRQAVALSLPVPTTSVKTKLVATPKDASFVKGSWPVALSLFLVGACIAALAWPLWMTAAAALHHPRLGWHALTKSRVFWMGLHRVVVPVGLCSDHQIPWTVDLGDTVAWVAAGGEMLVIVLAGWLYFRPGGINRTVGVLLGAALLDIVHRIANPNADLMVEARLYPAMAPFCILLAWGLHRLVSWHRDGEASPRPRLAAAMLGALLVTGIVLSARRAQAWRDTPTLVADILEQYPLQSRAWQELQGADARAGYWTETMKDTLPIRAALASTQTFNASSEHRKYLSLTLLLAYVQSEGYDALAMAKLGRKREATEHLASLQKFLPTGGEAAAACESEFLFLQGLTEEASGLQDNAVEDLVASRKLTGNPEAARELRRIWKSKLSLQQRPAY